MNLKPVELQIALPRTTDAGKVQNELQQRSALAQQQISGETVKQTQEQAWRSAEVDESADAKLHNGEEHGGNAREQQSSREKEGKKEAVHEAEHPYKGHRIDLSL